MNNFKLKNILNWKNDLLHLIYPNSCLICEKELNTDSKNICPFCKNDFQYTSFERYSEPTILDQLFWGRVQIASTYALIYFEKGKAAQPILHALKYKDKPEIGLELGELIGEKIINLPGFNTVEALIPVPIHPKKEFIRGYNQSEKLANGIAKIITVPVIIDTIKRIKNTESQTKKSRFKRWENVQNTFKIKNISKYNHIAIVDDVITTGATLEIIIQKIQEIKPNIRISIISLALTK